MLKKTTFEKRENGLYVNLEPAKDFSYNGCIDTRNKLDIQFYKEREKVVHDVFIEVLAPILDKLPKTETPLRILDIGCGDGAILKAFYALGKSKKIDLELFGLDIDPVVMKHMRFRVEKIVASATAIPLPANSFDLVTCSQTIEHVTLTNARKMIKEVYRVLKPGGMCYFETPNPESLVSKAMGSEWWMYIDLHLILFTPDLLARFLKRAGFISVDGKTRAEHDRQMDETKEVIRRLQVQYGKRFSQRSYTEIKHIIEYLQLGGITVAYGIKPVRRAFLVRVYRKLKQLYKKIQHSFL